MKNPSLLALLAIAGSVTALSLTACGEKKTTDVEKTTVIEKQVEVPVPVPSDDEGSYGERIGEKIDRKVDREIEEAIDSF